MPRAKGAEDDIEISLSGSGEKRRLTTYSLKDRIMFVQYSTASSRERFTPKNWYWASVGDLADRTRVGVYWPSDNLLFPGFIERRSMEYENER